MLDKLKSLIEQRDTPKLIELIQSDKSLLDLKDDKGVTVFFHLIYNGLNEAFTCASMLKVEKNLFEAVVSGEIERVKEWVAKDTSIVNKFSDDGFTALALASYFNQTEIGIYLFDNGGDPSILSNNPTGVNALHAAVARCNMELCRRFILSGVDVNLKQRGGVTALHSAVHLGNLELAKLLIEYGANVLLEMENGQTPLDFAKMQGNQEMLNLLQEANNQKE